MTDSAPSARRRASSCRAKASGSAASRAKPSVVIRNASGVLSRIWQSCRAFPPTGMASSTSRRGTKQGSFFGAAGAGAASQR